MGDTPPSNPPDGQPGTPPDGSAPGSGGANTMTYDYTGTLSGALIADGTSLTSDNESYSATTADQNTALVQNAGMLTVIKRYFEQVGRRYQRR